MDSQNSNKKLTLEAIFAHPDNAAVLRYLKIDPQEIEAYQRYSHFFVANAQSHPFDEGGVYFFQ